MGNPQAVADEWEVGYWTEKLGCSEEELRAAIKVVGLSARLAPLRDRLLSDGGRS
jgi:hypothetical protein